MRHVAQKRDWLSHLRDNLGVLPLRNTPEVVRITRDESETAKLIADLASSLLLGNESNPTVRWYCGLCPRAPHWRFELGYDTLMLKCFVRYGVQVHMREMYVACSLFRPSGGLDTTAHSICVSHSHGLEGEEADKHMETRNWYA